MSKELTPDISYSFKAPVWKTFPDPGKHIIALELRDNDTHRVSFSIVSLDRDQVILDDLVFEETWWISLSALIDPVLFVRIFPDEQDPGKSSLQAYDFRQNKLLWTRAGLVPVAIGGNEIRGYLQEGEDRLSCAVEISSGNISFSPQEKENVSGDPEIKYTGHNLSYPVQYHEHDEGFRTLSKFMARLDIEPVMAMDYLESGNYIIINHYRRFGKELVNFLLVVNRSGEILYHERAGSGSGIAMDSFFIMDNVLVFVRDKRNITGITLI